MIWWRSIFNHAVVWRDFFIDLIFPRECFSCREEGAWLCEECLRKIKTKDSQYCFHCRKEHIFGCFCSLCQADYFLDGVWIAGDYEDKTVSGLIKNFKYHFIRDLSSSLGKYLSFFMKDLISKNRALLSGNKKRDVLINFQDALLVPVPLHQKRFKWRGFNQAELLAKEVADQFNLKINKDNLQRIKHKKAQAKLGAEERSQNIKDCFVWCGDALIGKNIILIDDVATTGSTLNECAKVLKENGAGEVWGLVLARG